MRKTVRLLAYLSIIVGVIIVGELRDFRSEDAIVIGKSAWADAQETYRVQHATFSNTVYACAIAQEKKPLAMCPGIRQSSAHAIVSIITAEGKTPPTTLCWYMLGAKKLAYSLKKYVDMDMIMLVVDSNKVITPNQRASLNQSGWQLCDVTAIDPEIMASSHNRYASEKMFSKLHMWGLVEYDSLLYIDSDVIAVSSPKRVFTTLAPQMHAEGFEIGMVQLGYRWNDFNAGVMVVLPGFISEHRLRAAINTTSFNPNLAEQNFLNSLFRNRIFQLPHAYNLNNRNPTIIANDATHLLLAPAQPVFIHMLDKPWEYSLENWAEGIRKYWINAPPTMHNCSRNSIQNIKLIG